jgi:hypothetical protein
VLLVTGGGQLDTALAAPSAAPDPHPAAKGSAGTPAPDPYGDTTTTPRTEPPVTQAPVSTPVVVDTPSSPERSADTIRKTAPSENANVAPTRAGPPGRRNGPATEQPAAERRLRTVPVVTAAAADGGRLLVGGLALAALALASGGLLLFVTRAGSLEPRS